MFLKQEELRVSEEARAGETEGMPHLSQLEDDESTIISEPTSVYRKESNEKKTVANNSRAKTIAEKLGFVSYDEEELDRPTYLRMTDTHDDSSELR